ncbi:hypothetical protein [Halorussus halophilus]|uniref:hypothetical protein n=1 Tax=Halorussus halophilus TaxID=2650975 RepID=UPI0013012A97|nr:hypothetical protein [Halorussus halophilus]
MSNDTPTNERTEVTETGARQPYISFLNELVSAFKTVDDAERTNEAQGVTKTRRAILQEVGATGALTVGIGSYSGLASGSSGGQHRSSERSSDALWRSRGQEEPPDCEAIRREILQDLAWANDLLENCLKAQVEAQQKQEQAIEEFFENFPEFGVRRDPVEGYSAPDCTGLQERVDELEAAYNQPCETLDQPEDGAGQSPGGGGGQGQPQTPEETPELPCEVALDLFGLLFDSLGELTNGFREGLDGARQVLGGLVPVFRLVPPAGAAISSWLATIDQLEELTLEVDDMAEQAGEQVQRLGDCGAGADGESDNGPTTTSARNSWDAGRSEIQRGTESNSGVSSRRFLAAQPTRIEIDYESIDYNYREVAAFDPWNLQFDDPANQIEATVQDLAANALYLASTQYNIALSLRRYETVTRLRQEFQSMAYVDSVFAWSLAQIEIKQIRAIARNAADAAKLVSNVIALQSQINAILQEADVEDSGIDSEVATEEFTEWWATDENQAYVNEVFNLTPRQWSVFESSVTDALADSPFGGDDQTILLDEEWVTAMEDYRGSFVTLAETFTQLHAELKDYWAPVGRRGG